MQVQPLKMLDPLQWLQDVLMLLSGTVGQTTAAHAKRFNIFFQRGPADSFSSLHATPGREGGDPSVLMYGQPGTLISHYG